MKLLLPAFVRRMRERSQQHSAAAVAAPPPPAAAPPPPADAPPPPADAPPPPLAAAPLSAGIMMKTVAVWIAPNKAFLVSAAADYRVEDAIIKALASAGFGLNEIAQVTLDGEVLDPSNERALDTQLGDRRLDIMVKDLEFVEAEGRGGDAEVDKCIDALFRFTAGGELSRLSASALLLFASRAHDVPQDKTESGEVVNRYSQLPSVAHLFSGGGVSAAEFDKTVQQLLREQHGFLMSEKQLRHDVRRVQELLITHMRFAEFFQSPTRAYPTS
ncbi:hypothetical protein JKP88DRAFT_247074 [Tribonema minus]|uniref:Uncharacterized protein n=1 Tax=Tribonema minus TaxID=303371 RepID=A0A835YRE8_9STRA|nr:hypothetical protein JKP88DRAFT_247074 [Tribonema minus]